MPRPREHLGARWQPPHDPDTLPDTTDPSGPCPRCGRVSNFAEIATAPVSFVPGIAAMAITGTAERVDWQRVAVLECLGCHERVVVIEDQYIDDLPRAEGLGGGVLNYRGRWWWPPPGVADLDASVPADVADAYREGVRALAAQAPRAAAVMFRRTLEAIVESGGSDAARTAMQRSLAAGLRTMSDEGALDRSLADWANEIRLVGNAGGHYDPADDVTQDEASELSRLLRQLMTYLYEMPARIRRSRKQQPGA